MSTCPRLGCGPLSRRLERSALPSTLKLNHISELLGLVQQRLCFRIRESSFLQGEYGVCPLFINTLLTRRFSLRESLVEVGHSTVYVINEVILVGQFGCSRSRSPKPNCPAVHPKFIIQGELAGAIRREGLGNTRGIFRPPVYFMGKNLR